MDRPSPGHCPQELVATGVRSGGVHAPGLELDEDGVRLSPVEGLGPDDGATRGVRSGLPVLLHRVLAHLLVAETGKKGIDLGRASTKRLKHIRL